MGFGPASHFGSAAQSAEQPVVCGKAEGASPFGSATFNQRAAWQPTHLAWDQGIAGATPAGGAIARWCQSSPDESGLNRTVFVRVQPGQPILEGRQI